MGNHKLNSGIYQIVNTINEKRYIGSSVNIGQRIAEHKTKLKNNKHFNRYLQNAWFKYGENNFVFNILLSCKKKDLIFYEQRAIDVYKTSNGGGYNLRPLAQSNRGLVVSEKTRQKLREAHKGTKGFHHSKETKCKLSDVNKGKKHSKETRLKMSESLKGKCVWIGKKRSVETRLKMSESRKGNTNCLGRILSEETRLKISEGNKGKKRSEEIRCKLSEAHQRVLLSVIYRCKLSESLKGNTHWLGRKHSEETKHKMSEASKKYWEKRRLT